MTWWEASAMVPSQPIITALRLNEAVSIPIWKAIGQPANSIVRIQPWPSQTIEAELKTKKTRTPHKDYDKYDYHRDTREQRTDTCSQQAHFRQAQLSVYQDIIADNIQHISAEQYPHSGLSIRNSIRKLLEAIEQHHKDGKSQQNQIIKVLSGE